MDATAREILNEARRRAAGPPEVGVAVMIGRYRLRRVNRETGHEVITPWVLNAVTTEGRNRFCRQVTGLDSAPMNAASTQLVLKAAGGTTIKTLSAAVAPSHSGRSATWTFNDISVDVYTVASVEIQRTGTPAYTFSTATPSFSGGNSKPNTENWIYEYQLTLSGGTNFAVPYGATAGNAPLIGLERMLRHFTGNLNAPWTTGNSFLQINQQNAIPPDIGSSLQPHPEGVVSCDTNYPQVSDNVITWRFTTQQRDGLWRSVMLQQAVSGTFYDLGWVLVSRTKTNPSTWEYTLTLTIN